MTFTFIIIFLILIGIVYFFTHLPKRENKSKYKLYLPTQSEIYKVKTQIEEKGFWDELYEWKLSTETYCRIEPKEENGRKFFLTTIKCETEVKVPAKTIERAIQFKKIYESLQQELYYEVGWAGWESKDKL